MEAGLDTPVVVPPPGPPQPKQKVLKPRKPFKFRKPQKISFVKWAILDGLPFKEAKRLFINKYRRTGIPPTTIELRRVLEYYRGYGEASYEDDFVKPAEKHPTLPPVRKWYDLPSEQKRDLVTWSLESCPQNARKEYANKYPEDVPAVLLVNRLVRNYYDFGDQSLLDNFRVRKGKPVIVIPKAPAIPLVLAPARLRELARAGEPKQKKKRKKGRNDNETDSSEEEDEDYEDDDAVRKNPIFANKSRHRAGMSEPELTIKKVKTTTTTIDNDPSRNCSESSPSDSASAASKTTETENDSEPVEVAKPLPYYKHYYQVGFASELEPLWRNPVNPNPPEGPSLLFIWRRIKKLERALAEKSEAKVSVKGPRQSSAVLKLEKARQPKLPPEPTPEVIHVTRTVTGSVPSLKPVQVAKAPAPAPGPDPIQIELDLLRSKLKELKSKPIILAPQPEPQVAKPTVPTIAGPKLPRPQTKRALAAKEKQKMKSKEVKCRLKSKSEDAAISNSSWVAANSVMRCLKPLPPEPSLRSLPAPVLPQLPPIPKSKPEPTLPSAATLNPIKCKSKKLVPKPTEAEVASTSAGVIDTPELSSTCESLTPQNEILDSNEPQPSTSSTANALVPITLSKTAGSSKSKPKPKIRLPSKLPQVPDSSLPVTGGTQTSAISFAPIKIVKPKPPRPQPNPKPKPKKPFEVPGGSTIEEILGKDWIEENAKKLFGTPSEPVQPKKRRKAYSVNPRPAMLEISKADKPNYNRMRNLLKQNTNKKLTSKQIDVGKSSKPTFIELSNNCEELVFDPNDIEIVDLENCDGGFEDLIEIQNCGSFQAADAETAEKESFDSYPAELFQDAPESESSDEEMLLDV